MLETTAQTPRLLKRITEVRPEILQREIKGWDKDEFMKLQPFIYEHYWASHATINIFRVTGTQHPDYIGMSWLDFLGKGKRMSLNHRLYEDNPDYYDSCGKKEPTMYFQSIDGGELYVGQDGNHRTAIAKAIFYLEGDPSLHGVEVNDYRVDWKMKDLYDRVDRIIKGKGLPYHIQPVTKAFGRDDSGGWMVEKYEIKVKVFNTKTGNETILDAEGLNKFSEKIQKSRGLLGRVFSFI